MPTNGSYRSSGVARSLLGIVRTFGVGYNGGIGVTGLSFFPPEHTEGRSTIAGLVPARRAAFVFYQHIPHRGSCHVPRYLAG